MSKKAGIITHHDVHNHGAQLQMYALTRVLSGYGFDAKALSYRKNFDFLPRNATKKYNISLASIPFYAKYLVKNGCSRTLYNVRKKRILKSFRNRNSLVGEFYSRATDLDVTVIGSDEIFSIEPGLNPWFWGMGVPCDKVISYAASFGPTTIDFIKEKRAEEFIRAGISRLSSISVRDHNSKNIVEAYSSTEVPIVCDPVILYGYKDEIARARAKKTAKKDYILVYSYDNTMNDKCDIEKIKAYAKAHHLKIYSVGFFHKWCDKSINVDPLDIFDWFVNARFVVTDTFHGAVLSIVCNAPMCVKLKESNRNKLLWLMREYALEGRVMDDFSEIERIATQAVDFDSVNAAVETKRKESHAYLKDALEVI